MKKLFIICFVVAALLIPAYVFASSCEGEEGVDPTAEDIEQFTEIMMFVGGIMDEVDFEDPPPCMVVSEDMTDTSIILSVTFNNCVFEGITIDGTITITITPTGEYSGTITYTGSLTMSGPGAPCSSVSFNMTMTFTETSFSASGTVTIDGTTFKASGFADQLYYYGY